MVASTLRLEELRTRTLVQRTHSHGRSSMIQHGEGSARKMERGGETPTPTCFNTLLCVGLVRGSFSQGDQTAHLSDAAPISTLLSFPQPLTIEIRPPLRKPDL